MQPGDTFSALALKHYGNADLARYIAMANNRENPHNIGEPGWVAVIPELTEQVPTPTPTPTPSRAVLDLSGYIGGLPYASELTGTFQPMIGWKGGRSSERFEAAAVRDKRKLLDRFAEQFQAAVGFGDDQISIGIGVIPSRLRMQGASILLAAIAGRLPPKPPDGAGTRWEDFINEDALISMIDEIASKLDAELTAEDAEAVERVRGIAESESRLAAALLNLVGNSETGILDSIFYFADVEKALTIFAAALTGLSGRGSDRPAISFQAVSFPRSGSFIFIVSISSSSTLFWAHRYITCGFPQGQLSN